MSKEKLHPFMTPVEIVRIIASAIGVKASNKQLDTFAFKYDQPYTLASSLFKESISVPLSKFINKDFSKKLEAKFESMIGEYTELVNSISMDGITREETEAILTRWVLDTVAVEFNLFMGKVIEGPNYLTINNLHPNGITQAFDWLSLNIEWWDSFLKYIPKEKRHRFKLWKSNDELPKLSNITNIPDYLPNSEVEGHEWEKIKVVILAARFIDNLQRHYAGIYPEKLVNVAVLSLKQVEEYIWYLKGNNQDWLKSLGKQGLEIDYIFYKKHDYRELSGTERKQRSKTLIEELEVSTFKCSKFNMEYWLNWYRARWHALGGELKEANTHFKLTFEQALFFAGPSMPEIIKEALSIASSLKPTPDKAFIKRLKNSAILFGIDIPLHKEGKSQLEANRFDSVVEEWEIKLYEATFQKHFPSTLQFNVSSSTASQRIGPLLGTFEQSIRPNFRSPNKKIVVGDTWGKQMPQIVYFSWMNRVEAVSQLINKDVNVNALSDSNESALLFSILQMDVLDHSSSMDDSLFKLVTSVKHHNDVVNTKTSKKKLLPLVCAVDTGRPEVVAKVIEMGANVNLRGNSDNQSALFATLSRIGMIKRPDVSQELMQSHPLNDELLDTIRRHSNGLMGASLDEVKRNYEKQSQDPLFQKFTGSMGNLMIERVKNFMTLEGMREIAKLLINAGADANARHKTRINGFTPLMLAAELDEAELFEAMVHKNGEPLITAEHPETGAPVDSRYVAFAHQSNKVLRCLASLQKRA
ncbi:ankyrin repeat domain-containing protein [Thalassomonas actiniarum]|uniref:Ankyrin repeat domain-containing protein n=1 Tax=Thalassomonas actiniarum TaxID=485447 RepID=A0AAE9YM80_9GAMM|nr:ankyrin repeat domain-containing protein [Thalassomonas actiniarum]WDD97894.1 ankyrin repeat domain-containing protein [Thalassomonas actiniarum]